MNLLQRVKKIRGAEDALGLIFDSRNISALTIPDGVKPFGYSNTACFCFANGYQETVFAIHTDSDNLWNIQPIAYDFQEFLRLVFACGSAELAAGSSYLTEYEFREAFRREWNKPHTGLIRLREMLLLSPIRNPYEYAHTVRQVIDCSHLNRR